MYELNRLKSYIMKKPISAYQIHWILAQLCNKKHNTVTQYFNRNKLKYDSVESIIFYLTKYGKDSNS